MSAGGEAAEFSVGAEDQDLRGSLVDDGEGQAAIVASGDDPGGQIDDLVGDRLGGVDLIDGLQGGLRDSSQAEGSGERYACR